MLPLEGVRVVEFAHMVMGPSCGLVLADLGAEVIKVEPLAGDNTRRLEAAGAGFFPVFNRADPPAIGEHGAELLRELGYSPEHIAGLDERRIVAFPTNEGGGTR